MRQLSFPALVLLVLAGCGDPQNHDGQAGAQAGSPPQNQRTMPITPGSAHTDNFRIGDRVFFDYDSYALKPDPDRTLLKQAAWLKRYRQWKVVIEGHADERGTREYNLALGARRAEAVKAFLVGEGVAADRIATISYGKERPAEVGSNEAVWAMNRRVVTVLQK